MLFFPFAKNDHCQNIDFKRSTIIINYKIFYVDSSIYFPAFFLRIPFVDLNLGMMCLSDDYKPSEAAKMVRVLVIGESINLPHILEVGIRHFSASLVKNLNMLSGLSWARFGCWWCEAVGRLISQLSQEFAL